MIQSRDRREDPDFEMMLACKPKECWERSETDAILVNHRTAGDPPSALLVKFSLQTTWLWFLTVFR